MLRDIRLEDGGERWESHRSSCGVGLMARVRASRAYMCSASSLVTTIWSAVSLESVAGERWAVMADINRRARASFKKLGSLLGPAQRCKFLRLQANLKTNLKTNLHTLGNWVRVAVRSRVALTLASERRARKAFYWCCGDSSPGGIRRGKSGIRLDL